MLGGYCADLRAISGRIPCVRVAVCGLVAALATACGSAEPGAGPARYGISLEVPDGVSAEVTRGRIRIATSDLSVVLYDALATIRVKPGDYFPGTVEPPRFAPRSGWDVGDSGPAERYPHGEYVNSWATTIAFRDEEEEDHAWPPRRTLEALPPDGIVIQATLTRHPGLWNQNALRAAPPYRIRDFVRRDCPGKACEFPEYLLVAAYGDRYRVEIRVHFGRFHPTETMRAEADAMLAGLRFPDWGPWELEER
jgi:hypothetical protein